MADEWLAVRPFSVLNAARIWIPLLLVGICWSKHRRITAARARYYRLCAHDRETLVQATLFSVHRGDIEKHQTEHGYVRKPARVLADRLDREVHLVDECLRRLVAHGYLSGVCGGTRWHLATHISTTEAGRSLRAEHAAGRPEELAPWGALICRPVAADDQASARLVALPREDSAQRTPAP